MSADKFRVTSTVQKKTRTQIWDSSKPMPLDYQFRWILEKNSEIPQLRQMPIDATLINEKAIIPIDSTKNGSVEISNHFKINLKPLTPIPPAFMVSSQEGLTSSSKPSQLMAFSGSGKALLDSHPIHSAYIGYSRNKPVFTLGSSTDGYHIRPLLQGVRLKLKHQKTTLGEVGETWKLNAEDLVGCTLIRGSRWWRFNLIPSGTQTLDSFSTIETSLPENTKFRNLLIGFGTLFVALCITIFMVPHSPQKTLQEEPEAPVVKFVAPHAKVIQPKVEPKTEMEKKAPVPEAPAAPVKQAEPPAPKVAEAPPKEFTRKAESHTPSLVKPPAKTKMQAPVAAPVTRQAPQQTAAAKVAALKNVLGGALMLTHKSIGTPIGNVSAPKGLFNSGGTALKSTEIKAGYSGDNVKVKGLGGGSSSAGAGYAKGGLGHGIGGGGTGTSFASVDEKELIVEKGLLMEEVGAVIHEHMAEIRYCHETAMLQNPNLNGKVTVQFSIDPAGRVEKAGIQSSTVSDHGIENCILKKLTLWKFPKPKGGIHVAVSYPFIFKVLERE